MLDRRQRGGVVGEPDDTTTAEHEGHTHAPRVPARGTSQSYDELICGFRATCHVERGDWCADMGRGDW